MTASRLRTEWGICIMGRVKQKIIIRVRRTDKTDKDSRPCPVCRGSGKIKK